MKILSVIGARPQFVKAGVVSAALRKRHVEILVHTGQHYDDNMSSIFFRELGIPAPDHNLGIGSGLHGAQTGRMLEAIERVLLDEHPDMVLVYGDTNSTLAGALAASKLRLPLAHVEAGLRSFNRAMPEEINRLVADVLADLLFAPSETAARNLAAEGVQGRVHVVGDVMADALFAAVARARMQSDVLARLGLEPRGYLLATVHRAENTDDPQRLAAILGALGEVGLPVVLPLHPRTRAAVERQALRVPPTIRLIEPVGYLDMVRLESDARRILTDSGGVQKEAYWLGVPCVTLRAETEWVETVDAGWNRLVGADREAIIEAASRFEPPALRPALFGDGHAAEQVAELVGS
jgi:UDP-N-acetylglucosamine 2-epimerase